MSMIPSPTTSTTITTVDHRPAHRPDSPPSLDDATSHLDQAQAIVMELWRSGLPDLDGSRAAALVAAHRAITEARNMLERPTVRRYTTPALLG